MSLTQPVSLSAPASAAVAATPAGRQSLLPVYLVLGLLAFAGNYALSGGFGLYEDDYLYTLPAFSWSWSEFGQHFLHSLRSWPQGRPIGFAGNDLLSFVSAQGHTLQLGYLLGFALLFAGTLVAFHLARTWLSTFGALVAAAVYCLYPTDTSKVILMHRAFLLTGGLFMLSAFLCYRRGHFVRSYVWAALTLLTYETYFLPFLAAPLVVLSLRELRWRRILLHGVVCGGILGGIILIRRTLGDSRAIDTFSSLPDVAAKILRSLYLGPVSSLHGLWARPLDALRYSDSLQWLALLAAGLAVYAVLTRVRDDSPAVEPELRPGPPPAGPAVASLALFAAGCLLLVVLSFALAFRPDNYPPIVTIGRLSAFNSPGSIGAALLVGAIAAFAAERLRRARWVAAAAGVFVGALVSFGLEIQRIDYVENWRQQRAFWEQILATSGEWEPGVPVLVRIEGGTERPSTPGFPPYWMVNYAPFLADQLVVLPPTFRGAPPPRVYGFHAGTPWAPGAEPRLQTPSWGDPALWPVLQDERFIYFDFATGRLARVNAAVTVGSHTLRPKPAPVPAATPLPSSRLRTVLFPESRPWPTVAAARNYPQ